MRFVLPAVGVLLVALPTVAVPPDLVTAVGTEFARDGRAFRFIGVNLRGLVHYGGGDGALPYTTLGHIDENLAGARDMGCRVVRVFAANGNISHADAVGRLGYALDKADEYNLKLIIALTDFYPTPFHPQGDDGYYTLNPWGWTVLNHDWFAGGYQNNYLPYVTLAVTAYKNHPAVFSWQLGNEIADQVSADTHDAFVHAMAANIKAIDPDHMASIGMLSLSHIPGYTTQRGVNLFSDPNLDFLTAHSYNGETRDIDLAVRSAVVKPIIISEAGCDAGVGDRVAFMSGQVDTFVHAQAARGFMHWGYQAQAWDIGDGDNVYGFDRYAHPDYYAMYAMYQGHANVLNAYDEPVEPVEPPRGRNLALEAVAWDADSIYSGAYSGDKAFDGSLQTKWTSTDAASSHWLALDLGQPYVVTGYHVKLAGSGGEWASFNWTHFVIETGPGFAGPWTAAFDVDNSAQLSSVTSSYATPVLARCVRLSVDDCGVDDFARLPELEVIGDPPPRADFNLDDGVDLADFSLMQACYRGAGVEHPGTVGSFDCVGADLEHGSDDPPGGDVDLADVAAFLNCWTGPTETPPLECY
jgi:hypothetical protein